MCRFTWQNIDAKLPKPRSLVSFIDVNSSRVGEDRLEVIFGEAATLTPATNCCARGKRQTFWHNRVGERDDVRVVCG